MQDHKVCARCGENKSAAEYSRRTQKGRTYLQSQCKSCASITRLEWHHANRERSIYFNWRANLARRYGLTPEQYDEMAKAQGGRCRICKRKDRLVIDHCHTSNKIRGLLCGKCNRGIGHFDDNVKRLQAAITYLEG